MLKVAATSYLHLLSTLNFNIFIQKSRSNTQGIQLVNLIYSHPGKGSWRELDQDIRVENMPAHIATYTI